MHCSGSGNFYCSARFVQIVLNPQIVQELKVLCNCYIVQFIHAVQFDVEHSAKKVEASAEVLDPSMIGGWGGTGLS